METVELILRQRADTSMYWEVKVRSEVKPLVRRIGIIEFERRDQAKRLMALAGALAEELCERYHDTLDPSLVAKTAIDCYRELMAENPKIQPGSEMPIGAIRVAHHG